MKYIGIDYGTKKVGLAVSDGVVALPKNVLPNNSKLLRVLSEYINSEGVSDIVVGESFALDGGLNNVASDAKVFIDKLLSKVGSEVNVHYVDERFTTKQARAIPVEGFVRGDRANKKRIRTVTRQADAQAAAIILQSFLDKQKNLS